MATFHFLDGSTYDASDDDINILKNESNFICDLFDMSTDSTETGHKQIIKLDIQKTEFKIIIDYFKHDGEARLSFSKHSESISLDKKIKVLSASNYLMIDSIIEYITDEIVDIVKCADSVDELREIFMCNTEEDKKWSLRLPCIKEEFEWCKKPVFRRAGQNTTDNYPQRAWKPSGKILKKLYSLSDAGVGGL